MIYLTILRLKYMMYIVPQHKTAILVVSVLCCGTDFFSVSICQYSQSKLRSVHSAAPCWAADNMIYKAGGRHYSTVYKDSIFKE